MIFYFKEFANRKKNCQSKSFISSEVGNQPTRVQATLKATSVNLIKIVFFIIFNKTYAFKIKLSSLNPENS